MRKKGFKLKDNGTVTSDLALVTPYLFLPMFLIEEEMRSFIALVYMTLFFLCAYIKHDISSIYILLSLDLLHMP